jgi:hypothetical protein
MCNTNTKTKKEVNTNKLFLNPKNMKYTNTPRKNNT